MMTRAGRKVVINRTRTLESASFAIILGVVGLRPLIAESYGLAGPEMTSALPGVLDPLPVATLLLDIALLLGALLWGLSRLRGQGPAYRWTGLEPGLLLIAASMTISCFHASNRRTAINASIDWLSMAVAAVMLAQLLRDRTRLRIGLCVVVASGAAQAYQCFEQVFVSFEETEAMYRLHREEIWGAQGIPLDSAQVELFERRMAAREASGFLSHSNIAGAHLLLAIFAALGLSVSARDGGTRWAPGLCLALTAVLVWAMVLTHSNGALTACLVGIGLIFAGWRAGAWLAARRVQSLIAGWMLVVAAALGVVGYGAWQGSLPGQSLNFRWGYWTASAELVRDHPWSGVGRENFGQSYLQYKRIVWPEEVKNPHNFLVTAAAEWGIPGLFGVLLMLIGGSMGLTRPLRSDLEAGDPMPPAPSRAVLLRWLALLALLVFVPRWFLLGSDDRNYLYVATLLPAIVWIVGFAIAGLGEPALTSCGRGHRHLLLCLNAGICAFLLQDTINFASIVPGAATPFFALVGAALAGRRISGGEVRESLDSPRERGAGVFVAVASCSLAAVVWLVLPPVYRAGSWMRVAGSADREGQYHALRRATEADSLDPAPPVRLADWWRREAASAADPRLALRGAVSALDVAIGRDPLDGSLQTRKASAALALARATTDSDEREAWFDSSLASARRAVELYPSKPAAYVDLATCLRAAGEALDREDLILEALSGYRYALALDAKRPEWETIRRLSTRQVAEIESAIEEITQRPGNAQVPSKPEESVRGDGR